MAWVVMGSFVLQTLKRLCMIFVIFATGTATLPLFKGKFVFAGGTKFMQEKNELQTGSKREREFLDDIWVELTELKDMVAVCKRGLEEEPQNAEAVYNVMHIVERLLEEVLTKVVVQEDWYLEQSMINQSS